MKIAIDLRPLQVGHQYRGIGAYLTNVLTRFPFDTTNHTFIFLRYNESNPLDDMGLTVKNYKEVIMEKPPEADGFQKVIELVKKRLRSQFGDLKKHQPDVFLQPDFLLGLPRGRRIKKFVVMYDLIPLVFRDAYLPSWKKLLTQPGLGKRRRIRIVAGAWLKERGYRAGLKNLRRAHRIFSISEATTDDIAARLNISKSKIITIPLAASVPTTVTDKDRPKKLPRLEEPYLLFVGGVDERRQLAHLVHAFNLLNGRGRKFNLVLVGKELFEARMIPNVEARTAIMDSSYEDRVHLLGFTTQAEKAWLLKHAFAFVYPSLYEGFGLPVLEAMSLGCPVITYRNSSLTEIAGRAAMLLKRPSGQSIRDAVMELQDDAKLRQKLQEAGPKQAAKFSWEQCAEKTYRALLY